MIQNLDNWASTLKNFSNFQTYSQYIIRIFKQPSIRDNFREKISLSNTFLSKIQRTCNDINWIIIIFNLENFSNNIYSWTIWLIVIPNVALNSKKISLLYSNLKCTIRRRSKDKGLAAKEAERIPRIRRLKFLRPTIRSRRSIRAGRPCPSIPVHGRLVSRPKNEAFSFPGPENYPSSWPRFDSSSSRA